MVESCLTASISGRCRRPLPHSVLEGRIARKAGTASAIRTQTTDGPCSARTGETERRPPWHLLDLGAVDRGRLGTTVFADRVALIGEEGPAAGGAEVHRVGVYRIAGRSADQGELVAGLDALGEVSGNQACGGRTFRTTFGRPEFLELGGEPAELRVVLGLSRLDGLDLLDGRHLTRVAEDTAHLRQGDCHDGEDDRHHYQKLDQGESPASTVFHERPPTAIFAKTTGGSPHSTPLLSIRRYCGAYR